MHTFVCFGLKLSAAAYFFVIASVDMLQAELSELK